MQMKGAAQIPSKRESSLINTIIQVLAWVIGVGFLILGMSQIFEQTIPALMMMTVGLLFLPILNEQLQKRFKMLLRTFILLVAIMIESLLSLVMVVFRRVFQVSLRFS